MRVLVLKEFESARNFLAGLTELMDFFALFAFSTPV